MRVVVVDDQALIRRGIRLLLETTGEIDVVGEAGDGAEALEVIARTAPDVVLTDVRMPGMDGLTLVAELNRAEQAPPSIVLTTFGEDDLVRRSLDAGAAGFVMKDASPEELLAAVAAVADGGLVVDPRVARSALVQRPPATDVDDSPLTVLTRAERQVAELVATGASNSEIAERLVLAEGTIKNHVSSLLRKLGRRDRTALALLLHRYLG